MSEQTQPALTSFPSPENKRSRSVILTRLQAPFCLPDFHRRPRNVVNLPFLNVVHWQQKSSRPFPFYVSIICALFPNRLLHSMNGEGRNGMEMAGGRDGGESGSLSSARMHLASTYYAPASRTREAAKSPVQLVPPSAPGKTGRRCPQSLGTVTAAVGDKSSHGKLLTLWGQEKP